MWEICRRNGRTLLTAPVKMSLHLSLSAASWCLLSVRRLCLSGENWMYWNFSQLLLSKLSGSLHGFYSLHERQKEMRSPTYAPQHLVWILQTWRKANSWNGADICLHFFNLGVISVQKRLQKLDVQHIGNISKTYWTLKWLRGTFKHLWNRFLWWL